MNKNPNTIKAMRERYSAAYFVANTTVGIGHFVGGFGIFTFLVTAGVPAFMYFNNELSLILFLAAVLGSALISGMLYLVGIIMQAQGQILQASLDSAVNSSPFLEDCHKAEIMSLPFVSINSSNSSTVSPGITSPAQGIKSSTQTSPAGATNPPKVVNPPQTGSTPVATAHWSCFCRHYNPPGTAICLNCQRPYNATS